MKNLYRLFVVLALSFSFQLLNAQPWLQSIESEKPTFYEIRDAFNEYWKDREIEKGKGYKQFRRWEHYWESRIPANGEFPSPSVTWDAWQDYIKTHPQGANKTASNANWTFKGPSTTPGGYNGLGRLNCIAFHPTVANTFWVGSPAGGIWKTTNGGTSWSTNTDNLPVLGVSDIVVDYVDPNIMYIATGDGDLGSLSAMTGSPEGDTKSIGILKSTDGGNTWNTTGMNWNVTDAKLIRRLVMNPVYRQELLAATSDGIYQTLNSGATWTRVQTGYFIDVEFKPNSPDTAYATTYSPQAGTAQIYRSINYGQNWTAVANMSGVARINLAVTPAWPSLVDAVGAAPDGGLAGLWYSTNSGASFAQYYFGNSSNNLLHSSYNASGTGGQGYYDLAYAINPNNSNDIWLGGVNTWNSTDGGANWYQKTFWSTDPGQNPNGTPVVHADKHFTAFHPLAPGTMFECNDGGLYKTTNGGNSWTDISNGLQITQMYRIGVSQTTNNDVMCGLQDNGSRELYNNQWYERTGGDGMECIIDYTNRNIQYGTYSSGVIFRTYDSWANTATISNNIPGPPQGAWVTPLAIDPVDPATLYAGYKAVWGTPDRGDTWYQISPDLTADFLRSVAVAPSNTNTIYAADYTTVYQTTDGGFNWFSIGSASSPDAKITYIAVDPNNSQRIYLTKSGYVAGDKVWMTPDGGNNWYNYSFTLPNVPVNCIVYEEGTNEGLYIGTDLGVYYTNASMSDWVLYDQGLPNVVVGELEISYQDNKLWAGTFGRGLWSSDLFTGTVDANATKIVTNTFSVYPNPNSGNFTIQTNFEKPENVEVKIYNTVGEIVKEFGYQQTTQNSFDIQLETAGGLYFVELKTKTGNVFTKKIIVQ